LLLRITIVTEPPRSDNARWFQLVVDVAAGVEALRPRRGLGGLRQFERQFLPELSPANQVAPNPLMVASIGMVASFAAARAAAKPAASRSHGRCRRRRA
jgi:hypothetical protein